MIDKKHDYNSGEALSPWRESLNTIIFGAETRMGRAFDVVLIIMIICSVISVMLDSVEPIQQQYGQWFVITEWIFTSLFTLEYGLRLVCVRKPWLYCRSFFGLVDLLAILPSYLGLFFSGAKYMLVLRILRLLRIFRILKLTGYMTEADVLMNALVNSFRKILVFLYTVLTVVVVFGSLMYVVEGSESGFTSIPKSVYWAIVTLTTVGYGDIAPQSTVGQIIASCIMIMGYGIIAVPTGMYSVELFKSYNTGRIRNDACPGCGETGHDYDACFCKFCGHSLPDE